MLNPRLVAHVATGTKAVNEEKIEMNVTAARFEAFTLNFGQNVTCIRILPDFTRYGNVANIKGIKICAGRAIRSVFINFDTLTTS